VTFSDAKLRAIVNLLGDPLQAHAAAHALAEEARRRKMLPADLVAASLAPAQASAPPPPKFSDVEADSDRIDVAVGKRINFNLLRPARRNPRRNREGVANKDTSRRRNLAAEIAG
jgi:hypothetical protein